jgi:hypothetical protein
MRLAAMRAILACQPTDTTLSVAPAHHQGFFNTTGAFNEKRHHMV